MYLKSCVMNAALRNALDWHIQPNAQFGGRSLKLAVDKKIRSFRFLRLHCKHIKWWQMMRLTLCVWAFIVRLKEIETRNRQLNTLTLFGSDVFLFVCLFIISNWFRSCQIPHRTMKVIKMTAIFLMVFAFVQCLPRARIFNMNEKHSKFKSVEKIVASFSRRRN